MAPGMRIAQYHPRALIGDGGITNSVRRLSSALAGLGTDVVIVCDEADTTPPEPSVSWVSLPHVGVSSHRAPRGLRAVLAGCDMLVCNSAWTLHNVAAGRAARAAGVPYVLAPRGAYDPRIRDRRKPLKDLWWNLFERELVHNAAAVHIFFPEEREHLAALGYTGEFLVAPNGVTVPQGAKWDGGSGDYLLYIGRFDPEHKGLDLLVRAMATLPPGRVPPLRMHGPDWRGGKQVVIDLVRDLGVADRVLIGGPVYDEEKWALICAARGFVYPSRWEGFGNSTAEAAALGVPTLVTPYPLGLHLARRGAAFLAEAEVGSLAAGLERLCSDEAAGVGRRAVAVVLAELTWESVAQHWLQEVVAVIGREPDQPTTGERE